MKRLIWSLWIGVLLLVLNVWATVNGLTEPFYENFWKVEKSHYSHTSL